MQINGAALQCMQLTARFTKRDKLASDRNHIKAQMGVESATENAQIR